MKRIDVEELGEYIREQRKLAEMSLRQLAASAEVSNPYLSQIERGMRKPSAEILSQIAKGLRISAETLYVRAGILDDVRGDATVTAALLVDQSITDRQRQVLQEIYAAFQKENVSAGLPGANTAATAGLDSASEELGTTPVAGKKMHGHTANALASSDA